MNKTPHSRYENNYRYSEAQFKNIQKWLYISWGISAVWSFIVVFILYGIFAAVFNTSGDAESFPAWIDTLNTAIIVFGFAGWPLLYGAWFSGRSIHHWAPLGTKMVVVGVALCFYFGFISKVLMWLQLPIFRSPRLSIQ